MSCQTDDFIHITRNHRLCSTKRKFPRTSSNIGPANSTSCTVSAIDFAINRASEELDLITYSDSVVAIIKEHLLNRTLNRLISYGVGSINASSNGAYQMALLIKLLDQFKPAHMPVPVIDPHFTETELTWLNEHGRLCTGMNDLALTTHQEGVTLFYMPHCGRPLYNNVLYSHWTSVLLSNIIIIGNSFSSLLNSSSNSDVSELKYMLKVNEFSVESPFPMFSASSTAFNDTVIVTFSNVPRILPMRSLRPPKYQLLDTEILSE